MSYVIDLVFYKGEPIERPGGAHGYVRMVDGDADNVLDALAERVNVAIRILDNPNACVVCAVMDPEQAEEHTTGDHPG